MEVSVRRAVATDATALTQIMHASSAYRGDYARILEGFAVSPEQVECDLVFLAEDSDSGRVLGFYSLTFDHEPELDLMFVADGTQGTGIGRILFEHMRDQARQRGAISVKIVSHPPSVGFYKRMGAELVGTQPPSGHKVLWERPVLRVRTDLGHPA